MLAGTGPPVAGEADHKSLMGTLPISIR